MRLDLNVLWIDDQPQHVKSFAEGLRRKLRDDGFQLSVTEVSSLGKVDDFVGEHVHDDVIDLVLVDFDLGVGHGDGGEQALVKVRRKFPYKDLVFYSAADTDKLRKISYDHKLDGVYFSTRLSLVDDTCSVIENMMRKVLDIDHMRGVVMSATSDIDFLVERSLLAVHGRLGAAEKAEHVKGVIASLRAKLERYAKELAQAERKSTIEAIFKLRHLCTAADRLDLLFEQLRTLAGQGSTHLDRVRQYKDEVVPRRNKLAHVMLRIAEGTRALHGPEGTLSLHDMTKLRCELIEHRDNFTNIAVLVDAPFD